MTSLEWANDTHRPVLHNALVDFLCKRIGGGDRGFGACQTMGVFDGEFMLGAVAFHNYEPTAGVIEISAAADSKRWLGRKALTRIFTYAFEDCGCQMVVARISEDNKPLHRIFHSYGFTSYVIPRLRGRQEDERIFTLTDDAWRSGRFFRRPDGQAKRTEGSGS